jgi:hypothetical protein
VTVLALSLLGALALVLAIVLRRAGLVLWGLAALAAAYAVGLAGHRGVGASLAAPAFAAGLLACGEVAFAGAERSIDRRSLHRWAVWLAGVTLAAAAVASIVLLAATARAGRSLLLTFVGTVAAVGAVALLSIRARR